jgi:hypothetical protein
MRDPSEWIAREDNSFGTGIVVTNRINVRRYGPKLEDPIVQSRVSARKRSLRSNKCQRTSAGIGTLGEGITGTKATRTGFLVASRCTMVDGRSAGDLPPPELGAASGCSKELVPLLTWVSHRSPLGNFASTVCPLCALRLQPRCSAAATARQSRDAPADNVSAMPSQREGQGFESA